MVGANPSTVRAETPVGAASITLDAAHVGSACPSERQLATQVDAELASSARGGRSTDAAILVTIEHDATGFFALIEVRGQPNARRRLHAPRCEGLSDALAVAIAVVLDGHAARAAEANEPTFAAPDKPKAEASQATMDSPASASMPSIEPSARAVRRAPSVPRKSYAPAILILPPPTGSVRPVLPRHTWSWELWIHGGVAIHLSPLVSAGVQIERVPFQWRLGAWWERPRDVGLAPGHVSRVRVGGLTAACTVWGQAWRLSTCAQAWLGSEAYEGHDYPQSRSGHVFWSALGPSLGIETGQRLRIGLELLGLVTPWQDRYVAPASGNSMNAGSLALWLLLKLGLHQSFT